MNKIDDGLFNRISKHIIIICVSCVLLALLLIYEMFKVSSLNGRLEKYQQRYIAYAQAADMFENGSGILTNQARYFAETGDEEYLEGYFLELDADKHREKALALIEDIDDELDIYSYLEAAKLASDDLMDMEYHAMVLAASGYGYDFEKLPKQLMYYDISSYENGLDAEGKKAVAKELLRNDLYAKHQQEISGQLEDFMRIVTEKTNFMISSVSKERTLIIKYQYILIFGFVILIAIAVYILSKSNELSGEYKKELCNVNNMLEEKKLALSVAEKNAEDAMKTKSDFLTRMSHDLRTPINNIMGISELGRRHFDDSLKVKDYFGKINETSDELMVMIDELLDIGSIERGMVAVHKNPMSITGFMDNCLNILQSQISESNLLIIREYENIENLAVLGDEFHLRKVFLSIVENAIRFTRSGGRVSVRIAEENRDEHCVRYRFEIEDTGIGMSEQYLAHLFESFNDEDEYSESSGSVNGMGIAKKYVEIMGGTIGAESKLNHGSKITVNLKFDIYKEIGFVEGSDDVRRLDGLNIMVVEDNEINLEIARELLEEEGAKVTPAENGMIALKLFEDSRENSFDAILMDITMPVMDGFETSKRIRALKRSDAEGVPIIAMTANVMEEDKQMVKDVGMNEHIPKPVDISVLVRTLLSCIKKKNSDLTELLERALKDANTDSLTGVKNRNAFELTIANIDREIKNNKNPQFAIAICDVNGLKYVNDNIGHDRGDTLLTNSCKQICKLFAHSPVFRIGGDEFAVILRDEDYENRENILSVIMKEMTEENFVKEDEKNVSFAVGLASFDSNVDRDCNDVFKRADANMYIHKKSIKGEDDVR